MDDSLKLRVWYTLIRYTELLENLLYYVAFTGIEGVKFYLKKKQRPIDTWFQ